AYEDAGGVRSLGARGVTELVGGVRGDLEEGGNPNLAGLADGAGGGGRECPVLIAVGEHRHPVVFVRPVGPQAAENPATGVLFLQHHGLGGAVGNVAQPGGAGEVVVAGVGRSGDAEDLEVGPVIGRAPAGRGMDPVVGFGIGGRLEHLDRLHVGAGSDRVV